MISSVRSIIAANLLMAALLAGLDVEHSLGSVGVSWGFWGSRVGASCWREQGKTEVRLWVEHNVGDRSVRRYL